MEERVVIGGKKSIQLHIGILFLTIYCIVLTIISQYYFCICWLYLHKNSSIFPSYLSRWYKGIGRQAQEYVIGVFISQITACHVKARGRRPNQHVYNTQGRNPNKRVRSASLNDTGRQPQYTIYKVCSVTAAPTHRYSDQRIGTRTNA